MVQAGCGLQPVHAGQSRLRFYVDGEPNGTSLSETTIAAATFPEDQGLALLAGVKNGSGAAKSLDLDWWGILATGITLP